MFEEAFIEAEEEEAEAAEAAEAAAEALEAEAWTAMAHEDSAEGLAPDMEEEPTDKQGTNADLNAIQAQESHKAAATFPHGSSRILTQSPTPVIPLEPSGSFQHAEPISFESAANTAHCVAAKTAPCGVLGSNWQDSMRETWTAQSSAMQASIELGRKEMQLVAGNLKVLAGQLEVQEFAAETPAAALQRLCAEHETALLLSLEVIPIPHSFFM